MYTRADYLQFCRCPRKNSWQITRNIHWGTVHVLSTREIATPPGPRVFPLAWTNMTVRHCARENPEAKMHMHALPFFFADFSCASPTTKPRLQTLPPLFCTHTQRRGSAAHYGVLIPLLSHPWVLILMLITNTCMCNAVFDTSKLF